MERIAPAHAGHVHMSVEEKSQNSHGGKGRKRYQGDNLHLCVTSHHCFPLYTIFPECKLSWCLHREDSLCSTRRVDLGGIGPPFQQCECCVLPLNYRPGALYRVRSRIIFSSSLKNFLDLDSPVFSAEKTRLRLSHPTQKDKQFVFLCLFMTPLELTLSKIRENIQS